MRGRVLGAFLTSTESPSRDQIRDCREKILVTMCHPRNIRYASGLSSRTQPRPIAHCVLESKIWSFRLSCGSGIATRSGRPAMGAAVRLLQAAPMLALRADRIRGRLAMKAANRSH